MDGEIRTWDRREKAEKECIGEEINCGTKFGVLEEREGEIWKAGLREREDCIVGCQAKIDSEKKQGKKEFSEKTTNW